MPPIPFSQKQLAAISGTVEWVDSYNPEARGQRQVHKIFGYAGSGKTSLVTEVVDRLERRPRYMAYSGKAASVMRNKGCEDASTIHKAIYIPLKGAESAYTKLEQSLETETDPVMRERIEEEMNKLYRSAKQPKFVLNTEADIDPYTDVIVLDECSMVDEDIAKDILAFNTPLLVMGDPGQLPPVKGTGYIMENPEVMLTEIFRQAEGNAILDLATFAREGKDIALGTYGTSKVLRSCSLTQLIDQDQVLCGYNKTRIAQNQVMRRHLGRKKVLEAGDKIIITVNNYEHERPILNGQLFTVTQAEFYKHPIGHEFYRVNMTSLDDPDISFDNMLLHLNPLVEGSDRFKERWLPYTTGIKYALCAQHGYAITVHKSQGSQWDNVALIDDWMIRDSYDRWKYTGITRAAETLIISGT